MLKRILWMRVYILHFFIAYYWGWKGRKKRLLIHCGHALFLFWSQVVIFVMGNPQRSNTKKQILNERRVKSKVESKICYSSVNWRVNDSKISHKKKD